MKDLDNQWIDVKDKHFADITQTEKGYEWESDLVDEPFMVAVPINKGYYIQQVILVDEVGLQCYTDDGGTYFEWEITDISHWFRVSEPE